LARKALGLGVNGWLASGSAGSWLAHMRNRDQGSPPRGARASAPLSEHARVGWTAVNYAGLR
jgi:hypothetical protein